MTQRNMEVKADQFWEWFSKNADTFHHRPATEVVDVVVDRLHSIDEELSAEVSGLLEDNSKELVLTSHGETSLFEFIIAFMRRAPDLPLWRIRALKPPRGFDFSVAGTPGLTIRKWKFVPLKRTPDFTELGIRIEMSRTDYDLIDGSGVASILEEGVGEVLLSVCTHIEFTSTETPDALPIDKLAETLHVWSITRGPDSIHAYLPTIDY